MIEYDLQEYLGDVYDKTTPEQREAMLAASRRVDERFPDPDAFEEREQAFGAAVAVILGDQALRDIGGEYVAARRAAHTAHARLTGALIAAAPGTPETRLAADAGVSRPTVRKALGKSP